METKEQEEDARSIFLHITQEQLNSQVRRSRAELETKEQEEDARSIFLHFTQEQLNSQVRRSSVTHRRAGEAQLTGEQVESRVGDQGAGGGRQKHLSPLHTGAAQLTGEKEQLNSQVSKSSSTHR